LRYLRKALLVIGLLLLAAIMLLWFLPARWVLAWAAPRLHGVQLQQVHGSVWDGRAGAVTLPDGRALGSLQWQLSRRALLGQRRMRLALDGPVLALAGNMRELDGGRTEWSALHGRARLDALGVGATFAGGVPHGELEWQADHLLLQGNWPLQLGGQLRWRDAALDTPQGHVVLGELRLQAHADGGVIEAQLSDAGGGPLDLEGQLQLSPFGWRLDATLQARQTEPALRRWLATLAEPAADGSVHLQRHGGLALPSTH